MSIFNKFKKVFSSSDNYTDYEFNKIIDETLVESMVKEFTNYRFVVSLKGLHTYENQVKTWEDARKIDFSIFCLQNIHAFHKKSMGLSNNKNEKLKIGICISYVTFILRSKLSMTQQEIQKLINSFLLFKKKPFQYIHILPTNYFLNQLEKQYLGIKLEEETLTVFKSFQKVLTSGFGENPPLASKIIIEKIDRIIFASEKGVDTVKPCLFVEKGVLSKQANNEIKALPEIERIIWYQLIAHAKTAKGGKPKQIFLSKGKSLIDEIGTAKFKKTVNSWFVTLTKADIITIEQTLKRPLYDDYTWQETTYLYNTNSDIIKGLVWFCSHFHDKNTLQNICALAERTYKKIPGVGPAAGAVGNACFYTLYKSKGLEGIGQLSKLKLRIKQTNAKKLIEKYLTAAAEEKGMSPHEIEDIATDDYGMIAGVKSIAFDDYRAEISIVKVGKTILKWFRLDGKEQKSIPAFVKTKYKTKLAQLKKEKKQIEQMLTAQRNRIDLMFRKKVSWTFEDFQNLYFNHGLRSWLTQKIIWNFIEGDKKITALWFDNQWVNQRGEQVSISEKCTVQLWHPAEADTDEVQDWRSFLLNNEILQPLKQAFREVYLLTDAEINTETYSNRMAAHILKQHQFNMLAKTRGWKYSLLGAFDNGYNSLAASIDLPDYGFSAEFWLNEVNIDDAFNETGIWLYIATDQVRFIKKNTRDVLDLEEIPVVVFSEIMRDTDLFVGVASVGNDPNWRDNGGVIEHYTYWENYSFGDLSETAKTRKTILENLVPRLKIRDCAEVKDKYLVVRGKIRTYNIHIGSGNILMEPNGQYLCIVADRSQKDIAENLFIPFEGDRTLSIVLSKAFLLAEDDKIEDRTITSQIKRR